MPELRCYHLFISHAWRYGEAYDRLERLLKSAPNFTYVNWSAPEDKPVVPKGVSMPDSALRSAIKSKISHAHCVLVIAGMYAAHSAWMQTEIDLARELKKPLVGIRPWGNTRMPTEVLIATREDVGWNTASIVAAIRQWSLPRS